MQKWEYGAMWVSSAKLGCTFQVDYQGRQYKDNDIIALLSEWGARGWELLTVLQTNTGMRGSPASMLIFKRPVEE
jgi:hypothetical protein